MPLAVSRHHRPFTLVRIFLRLWVVVTIPLGVLWWFDGLNPVHGIINDMARDTYIALYRGTFHLVQEDLETRPVEQWPQHIVDLAPHFGYRLVLEKLESDSFSALEKSSLRSGEFLFRGGEPAVLVRRVAQSRFVLQMFLGETQDEIEERRRRGTMYLLQQQLKLHPPQQWAAVIAAYQPHFGFAIDVLDIDSDRLSLSRDQKAQLRRNRIYTYRPEQLAEVSYILLDDRRHVIRAETRSGGTSDLLLLVIAFSTLCGALALGIYIWLRPLWRDLKHMDTVAAEFGEGYFDARAALKNSSVVAGLGQSFNSMAASIQQLIDGQKELINAVSHDLRTPMSRLRFALEMLETENDTEDRDRYIHNIQHSVASLEELINELLVHARFERTPSARTFNNYAVYSFLTDEVALFVDNPRGIEVVWIPPGPVADLQCVFDRGALARALANLLENALRYADHRIEVSFTVTDGWCRVMVDDDGCGVAAADRERIFKPFTRLDDNAEGAGHGLGLAIVGQIAKWHKGRTYVVDAPAGGARFVFEWPADL
ncbi:hypothetical protein FKG94_02680 [Exilibacterium tricleocarpae]|uniref:histidine kinase n=1 Tax=Exilibacterium tricleocarpae TaxID=2591008 RepID=A0A545U6P7_9GAMM|nr:ATP-binding protein [Exilibacterium tricleocarpae]TQV85114.1 hypothetical protein FKG94_02680 [Exilibacterium tricleocarpae]